ncbi:hypothetical protein V9T40_005862 [Parthenolecanium corni]|uniref:RNA-directed DNA polymerase n=1 Tax=Parthenolecanium corni TaxID=536013 RepID=A0AAN9TUX8_9HEMI
MAGDSPAKKTVPVDKGKTKVNTGAATTTAAAIPTATATATNINQPQPKTPEPSTPIESYLHFNEKTPQMARDDWAKLTESERERYIEESEARNRERLIAFAEKVNFPSPDIDIKSLATGDTEDVRRRAFDLADKYQRTLTAAQNSWERMSYKFMDQQKYISNLESQLEEKKRAEFNQSKKNVQHHFTDVNMNTFIPSVPMKPTANSTETFNLYQQTPTGTRKKEFIREKPPGYSRQYKYDYEISGKPLELPLPPKGDTVSQFYTTTNKNKRNVKLPAEFSEDENQKFSKPINKLKVKSKKKSKLEKSDSSSEDQEPDVDELWEQVEELREGEELSEEEDITPENALVKLVEKISVSRNYPSLDPGKIKPYKEGDERSPPAFIDEFEGLTGNIKDQMEKGMYFRRLFKVENYPRSGTMPRNVPYSIMKQWFLKIAWNRQAKKERGVKICSWTKESTGTASTASFLQLINSKLMECDVKMRTRKHVITCMAPLYIAKNLELSDFQTAAKLNHALVKCEKDINRYKLLKREFSKKDYKQKEDYSSKAVAAILSDDEISENEESTPSSNNTDKSSKPKSKDEKVIPKTDETKAVRDKKDHQTLNSVPFKSSVPQKKPFNRNVIQANSDSQIINQEFEAPTSPEKQNIDVKRIEKRITVIALEKDPITPRWMHFRVFGDKYFLSWLKYSKYSNMCMKINPKILAIPEVTKAYGLLRLTMDASREGDEVIMGMSEYFIDDPKFCLDDFTEKLKQLIHYLLDERKVKTIVIATIPLDPEKIENSSYRARVKKVNSAIWFIKNIFTRAFVLDLERRLTPFDEQKPRESRENNRYFENRTAGDHLRFSPIGVHKIDNELIDLNKKFISKETEPPVCTITLNEPEDEMNSDFQIPMMAVVPPEDSKPSPEYDFIFLEPGEQTPSDLDLWTDKSESDNAYSDPEFPSSGEEGRNVVTTLLGHEDLDSSSEDNEMSTREKASHLYVKFKIKENQERSYMMMIDDGSPNNYITNELLSSIEANNPDLKISKVKFLDNSMGVAAGKTTLKTLYTCQLSILVADASGKNHILKTSLRVVKELNIDMIIGLNFLCLEYGAVIDYKYRTLKLRLNPNSDATTEFNIMRLHEMLAYKKLALIVPPNVKLTEELKEGIDKLTTEMQETPEVAKKFQQTLIDWRNVFRPSVGKCNVVQHELLMDPEIPFMDPKERLIPHKWQKAVENTVDAWEQETIVSNKNSDYYSPLTIVLKTNGEPRVCLDSREINKYMRTHGDTVPKIDEIKTRFHNARYFSKIDFRWGFLQIPLDEKSKQYTAFRYKGKPYVFNRISFGLKDSMPAFINAMKIVLTGCETFTAVYVDDVLIYSATAEEHLQHLRTIFEKVDKANMTLRLDKCSFFKSSAKFLGYVIDRDGIRPDPERAEAITQYGVPTNKREIQSFLGVVGYYRNHIHKCADLEVPLRDLTKLDVPFVWGKSQQEAFDTLKREIAKRILQAHPDWTKPFFIATDASNYAIAGIVMQIDDQGHPNVVAMCSRILTKAERNYATFEKELLAMVYTLKKNYYMLLGYPIKWKTDHQALTHFLKCEDSSQRVSRWRTYMNNYDIIGIEHIPGIENVAPDALSRYFEVLNGPRNLTHPPVMFIGNDGNGGNTLSNLMNNMKTLQRRDPEIRKAVREQSKNVELIGDICYYKNRDGHSRIYLPQCFRNEVIKLYHERYTHPGVKKTIQIIRRHYDWPHSRDKIIDYCRNCMDCRRNKAINYTPTGTFKSIVANKPLELLSVDIFGPITRTDDKNSKIIVIMDVFTKFCELYAIPDSSMKTCSDKIEEFMTKYGKAEAILTDRALMFSSPKWKNHWESKGIKIRLTAAYTPQSNPVETRMKVIGDCLRIYCPTEHHRWDKFIRLIQKRLNETEHNTTGFTPISLFLRKEIIPTGELIDISDAEYRNLLKKAQENTNVTLQKRRKFYAQLNHRFIKLYPGDQVLAKFVQLSNAAKRQTGKLFHKWNGPYTVTKEISQNTYEFIDSVGHKYERHIRHLQKV